MVQTIILAGASILILAFVAFVLTRLYKKATKEVVFIRTGFGGEKVVMDGGALVIPVLHETQSINMSTVKLVIVRKNEQSLITKDKLRADVSAEFYLRVKLTKEAISIAAQTLGSKTLSPEGLLSLMEGKLVDALRSTAAGMDMAELHDKRSEFVQKVQQTVLEDLGKNGLELESISLTGLDQTDIRFFNIENIFDAEGAKKITEQTELRKKEKNAIEQQTKMEIEEKNLEADKKIFEIHKSKEEARINAETEVKNLEAKAQAGVLKVAEEQRRDSEIAKTDANKKIQESIINNNKEIESVKIKTEKELAISSQESAIEIANKSQEELKAKTAENLAKADEIAAQEKIKTAQETEIANRIKELAIIEAEKLKESIIIKAKGESEGIMAVAEAKEKEYKIDAAGKKSLLEAENSISDHILMNRAQMALIAVLPEVMREMVKPMENIDSIKIVDAKGIAGGSGIEGEGSVGGERNFPNDILNATLKHKAFNPMLEGLIGDLNMGINLNSSDINEVAKSFSPVSSSKKVVKQKQTSADSNTENA